MNHQRITRSAALGLALAALAAPTAAADRQLLSPDAREAALAQERYYSSYGSTTSPDVTVVKVPQPSPGRDGGIDWGDAGIGAGGLLGVILLALGSTLAVMHRRRAGLRRRQTAITP